ncbi:hypothetical protein U1Q18_052829 [Sarracenia purpurea var. burkii]
MSGTPFQRSNPVMMKRSGLALSPEAIEPRVLLCKLHSFIQNHSRCLPSVLSSAFCDVADSMLLIPLPMEDIEDEIVWPYSSTGQMSVSEAYSFCRDNQPMAAWARHL